MQNNDLYYVAPEIKPISAPVPLYQAVKAMIFGLVALSVAEVPFIGMFVAPIFAIISLAMGGDYKSKYPGAARGFLRAGKITAIIALPMCVLSTILCVVNAASSAGSSYFYY